VEVNPRYPASTEILEYASGIQAMVLHRLAFDTDMPKLAPVANAPGSGVSPVYVGKALLFAKRSLEFPQNGPWSSSVNCKPIDRMPEFADIPEPGREIRAGAPIMTFFAQSPTLDGCLEKLKQRAQALDQCLWKP
jgi:predicted ATP-grasp superfamily ATP-dependent carboligase